MKRVNNIFDKIISIDNLIEADKMARRGKKISYGVSVHDRSKDANIIKLHNSLKSGNYRTSEYKTFIITDPKEREIFCLPYYPDRIVHWAIMLQLEPVWMKVFTSDSYSCIKGRGIHGAAKAVHRALMDFEGTKYCLKLDIKKFYPSIDQGILMQIIQKKIKCKRTLALLSDIIYSTESGLPIGNYISQYAANLYLTYFDHYVKETIRTKYYFRYCDDLVFLSNSKERLRDIFAHIEVYLKDQLRLTIKNNYQIFPVDDRGIDFVGYRFYHTHCLLRKRIKQNLMRKHAALKKKGITGKNYKQQMAAYYGWLSQSFSSTKNLIKEIDNMIKFSDFNIDIPETLFEGKKISIEDIFNVPLIIKDYKIEDSKFTGKNKSNNRLVLSVEIEGSRRVVFTGSDTLMNQIKKVPKEGFPFETVIKKKEKRFEFT
jgi:retron-type reverse transcriptase